MENKPASLTLEHDCNRIVYTTNNNSRFFLHIVDYIGMIEKTKAIMPVLFKRTIHLGNTFLGKQKDLGDIYLGLTDKGLLYTFWTDAANTIQYRFQKCATKFINIAGDETKKTASGFKPYIGLISDDGKLYTVNLMAFHTPTLLLSNTSIMSTEEVSAFHQFYYKNSEYAISNGSSYFITCSDTFERLSQ